MASDNESDVSYVEFQDEDIEDSRSESSFSEDTDHDSEDEGEPLREEAWRELDTSCPPAQPRFYFQGESSVNFEVAPGGSVLQYLELFFDDEVIGHITNETNRYAAQCLSEKPSSSRPRWHDTSAAEIRVFCTDNTAKYYSKARSRAILVQKAYISYAFFWRYNVVSEVCKY
ncbi:hypothetical protein J437_LFUL018600 [Ladona fulva]|uniref:PiggyBac transposable element-derived protein domain-containing protein n=1 Tax=Ladona fulva TaxID=123851 RepID=A0A8K0KL71_LADFU|nr:hypothetical protein J437_LFUL018600 [Ladona fulva]